MCECCDSMYYSAVSLAKFGYGLLTALHVGDKYGRWSYREGTAVKNEKL